MNSRNLAIVEDDPEVRRLLGGYLRRQPGLNVVLVCESAEQFLAGLPDTLPPAVVLLDLGLPGPSTDKAPVLAAHVGTQPLTVADVVKNPYALEFLGLEEWPGYRGSDLKQANTDHLQTFLVELGCGFYFEARQKRITFDNDPYFIDLVCYHRILKCHVLVALRLGAFSHADAGQMNGSLNYYREREMTPGDNPPVGLILCAQKNDMLVRYATSGLSEQLFVRKHQVSLPTEGELQGVTRAEQERFQP